MSAKQAHKPAESRSVKPAEKGRSGGDKAALPVAASWQRLAGSAAADRPAQIRGLQRTLGNRVVQRLLADTAGPTIARLPQTSGRDLDVAAPAGTGSQQRQLPPAQVGAISRAEFETLVTTHFGVGQIHNGTMAQQQETLRSQSGNSAFVFAPAGWQAWNPGASSEVYSQIVNGFRDFVNSFGGLPHVNEIIFHGASYRYDRASGRAIAEPNVGGAFGAGTLAIYQRALRGGLPMPQIISHELGHGLVEIGLTPSGGAPAPDANLINDYKQAAGWSAGATPQLYDIGVPAVATALAAGRVPDAQYQITRQNWSNPRWQEKPISAYMTTHPSEDLPEAVRGYVHERALLQANSPRRFAFVASRIARLYPFLRPVTPETPPMQQPGDFPAGSTNMG